MSDTTILMKLEDLINIAMGPANKNTVNFKLIHTILHILARQMRMLETTVELRVEEMRELSPKRRKSPRKKTRDCSTEPYCSEGKKKPGDSEKSGHKGGKKGAKGKGKGGEETSEDSDEDEDFTGDKKKGKRSRTDKELSDKKGRVGRYGSRGSEDSSATSITVTEQQRGKDKVLVVGKGARADSKTKVGSIEVVNQAQFAMLEAAINELKSIAGPIPIPELPDNAKLRADLAKGSASLPDTMQAMQVTARLKATEEAISRMAGLLSALSAAGALPEGLLDKFGPRFDKGFGTADGTDDTTDPKTGTSASRKTLGGKSTFGFSRQSAAGALVTHPQMDNALRQLKDDLMKNLNNMVAKSANAAETALNTANAISASLAIALKLNTRITTLNSMVSDYVDQLSGFDAGLTTQIMSFQEQMAQLRADLTGGLTLLEQSNNNAETAAIMELNERYEELVSELERTAFSHQGLATLQMRLTDDMHNLLECVETLREQKSDRDEVLDGLRDKADISRLNGLLSEVDFAIAREQIDRRLEVCYEKFSRQDAVWMAALNELKEVAETKAQYTQLLAMKEETQQELQQLHELINKLAIILGEPKAAILTRILSKNASCGVCQVPALMEALDANHGAPPLLPAMKKPSPIGADEEPCVAETELPRPPENREHECHRWVGGSHTLIPKGVNKMQTTFIPMQSAPTHKYTGFGSDGRLYMLEEDLKPCGECNYLKSAPTPEEEVQVALQNVTIPEEGAGDRG